MKGIDMYTKIQQLKALKYSQRGAAEALGIHRDKGSKKVFIRAFNPFAINMEVIDENNRSLGQMTKLDDRGFFQINFDKFEKVFL